MYYYIVDLPNSALAAKISERLQELITPMGISGEIAIANPARNAEELAYMGIDKGYTTIIAVGGDALVNKLATIFLNESRERLAFGIVPIEASALLTSMVGSGNNDLKTASAIIKQRHLELVDAVQLSSKQYMITEAYITASRKMPISLDIDQKLKAEFESDMLHISNDLVLTSMAPTNQGFLQKIWGGGHKAELSQSQFHGKQIRITAHEPLPIIVAGEIVAKTPSILTKIPAALKLITARAIVTSKNVSDFMVKSTQEEEKSPSKVNQERVSTNLK